MVLLDAGDGVQESGWGVSQLKAAGFCRVYYIRQGTVFYQSRGETCALRTGGLYLFPSRAPYSIRQEPEDPIGCFWLHLDLSPVVVGRLIELPVPADCALELLLRLMRTEARDHGNATPFFLCLARALEEYFYAQGLLPRPDPLLADVLRYIQEHFREPDLNVTKISARFHYTPEHFIRLFRGKLQTTPFVYLTRIRLNEGARLLLQGASVKQAAGQCGYTDSKTFSYAFKQNYEVSPSSYQQYYRAIP